MNKKEKALFLQLIMENIVEGVDSNLHNYVEESLNIACELNLKATIHKLQDFKSNMNAGIVDGKSLICRYQEGGILNMENIHNLSRTIVDKSPSFKNNLSLLTSPQTKFSDWEEFETLNYIY